MTAASDSGFPGHVRALTQGDVPALVGLTRDRGWKAGEAMWRLVLKAGDGYGIDASDGGLAGAVALARYPPGLAVIGMGERDQIYALVMQALG